MKEEHGFEWGGRRYKATEGGGRPPLVRCADGENPHHLVQHAAPAEILRLAEEIERLRTFQRKLLGAVRAATQGDYAGAHRILEEAEEVLHG